MFLLPPSSHKILEIQWYKTGYPFFDVLKVNNNENYEKGKILIAPSWNPDIPDFYDKCYSKIIDDLLRENFKIIFRPHPEYHKRFSKNYIQFKNRYMSNANITFDQNSPLYETFSVCENLITDWSGIAYEFVYSCKRGVIFNNVPLNKTLSR